MPTTHIDINDQLPHGRLLRRGLQLLEEAIETLTDVRDCLPTMIDGDGSDTAHYALVTTKFGTGSNAAAKTLRDELNSLLFKLTTDGNVSDVNAARLQLQNLTR